MFYKVKVRQGGVEVWFRFGGDFLADAVEFVKTCMETSYGGTEVSIEEVEEVEE